MTIRKATKKDFEEVLKLVEKLYGEKVLKKIYKNWKKEYLKLLKDTFIIEENKKIVAYVCFDINENSIYIADLYVLPECRKRGIATKLVNSVDKMRKIKNKKYLRVDVRAKDKPAVNFYKKLNFKILEPKDNKKSWRMIK